MAVTLFEVAGKLTLDKGEFDSKIGEAESSGQGLGSKLASGLGKGAKALGVGIAAVAAGVVAITKTALENYGQYEQLIGGVETMFGDNADIVFANAEKAFETAGMSMNDYMDQVTSTSAALISSLGGDTAEAARIADQAIIDMSDNANKMGTNIESITNAYQGFAKGNFTMLDNLKLGYGGTRSEMQRLIRDANKIRKAQGKNADLTIDSYADIVEAIHTVQEEMGITGTTQEEASQTIQGSLSAMKASWDNFLTVLGTGNKDQIKTAVTNLTNSFKTFATNVVPVLSTILTSLGDVLPDIVNALVAELPGLASSLLPPLISAAGALAAGLIEALPGLIDVVVQAIPGLLSSVGNAIINVFDKVFNTDLRGIWDNVKGWFSEKITAVVTWAQEKWANIKEHWEDFKANAGKVWKTVVSWAQDKWANIKDHWEDFKSVVDKAWTATVEWAEDLWDDISPHWEDFKSVVNKAWTATVQWAETLWDDISVHWEDFKSVVDKTWTATVAWAEDLWDDISVHWEDFKIWAGKAHDTTVRWCQTAWASISANWDKFTAWAGKAHDTTVKWLQTGWATVKGAINTISDWVSDKAHKISLSISSIVDDWIKTIKDWVDNGIKIFANIFGIGSTGAEDPPTEGPAAPGATIEPITFGGQTIPEILGKSRSRSADTQAIADAVSAAIMNAFSNMRIDMDGQKVGDIVTEQVSRNMANSFALGGAY